MDKKISILIPAFNEEEGIVSVITHLKTVMDKSGWGYEIVVVDDGSKDRTAELVTQQGSHVQLIKHPTNMGYGQSLITGIKNTKYDYVGMIDADDSYPPIEIIKLLHYAQEFDVVIGARQGKHFWGTFIRYPMRLIFLWLAQLVTGEKIPDVNSGLRVFKKKYIEPIFPVLCRGFSFTTTMTLNVISQGLFVKFVPIEYSARKGHSKIRFFRDTLRISQILVETIIYYNPLKMVLILSMLPAILTVALVIGFFVAQNDIYLISAVISFCSTIVVFVLGAVLSSMKMNRKG